MKLSQFAVIGAACLAFAGGATHAYADDSNGQKKTKITVLRTDTTLENAGKLVDMIHNAIAAEVKSMSDKYTLSEVDFTYAEVQLETGCEEVGDSVDAAECYKQTARLKKVGDVETGFDYSDFVMSSYDENGQTQIIWYHAKDESYKIVNGKVWNEKSAEELAHEIFVRKLVVFLPDATSHDVGADVDNLHEALLRYARTSQYLLDEKKSEMTYSEIQMVTECMETGRGNAANMCYILASSELGAEEFIFSNIDEGGQTQVVWYGEGSKGIHVYTGKVTDLDSAEQLAKEVFIGKVGYLKVTSNVPGASVYISGERVGMAAEFETSAQPIELVAREQPYEVTVREKGYSKEEASRIVIREGETSHVHVEMATMTDPEEIRKAVKIAGYSTLGAGVLAAVAGGVLYYLADDKNNELNSSIKSAKTGYDFKGSKESADSLLTGSVAAFGVGGFLLVAGAVLTTVGFVYDFSYESMEASNGAMPKIDFNITPDYQGMTLGWKF